MATNSNSLSRSSASSKYQLLDPLRPDEYAALKADIKARGVLIPAEEDESGNTLDGHHRKAVAAELGIECPVIVRAFASEREKREHVIRINLARRHLDPIRWGKAFSLLVAEREIDTSANHNRHTPRAATVAALAEELGVAERTARHRVKLAEKYDSLPKEEKAAVDSGEKTVHKAAREVVRREELVERAKATPNGAGKQPEWKIVRGEVGKGDACPLLDVECDSVRLVFADPPYNIGLEYGEGHDDRQTDLAYLSWCERWMHQCADLLTPDGSMWVLIGDEYAAEYALILKRLGLTIRNWIIWYESFGVNCADKFNRTKRHLFYCVRDPDNCVFHFDAVSRPSDRQTKYNDARANPGGKVLDDVWTDIPRLVGTAAERIPDFPTQLPLALLRRVVGCCTDPGDTVLDPFSGSGTTGAVCIELGRRYLGVERSKEFARLSELRLKGVRRVSAAGN